MSHGLDHINKIDAYLHAEAEAQFPTSKRVEIMSKRIPWTREELERLAKIKGKTVKECIWCGKPVLVDDSRQMPLCFEDESGRSVIKRYIQSNHIITLTEKNKEAILNSHTLRQGNGKAFN